MRRRQTIEQRRQADRARQARFRAKRRLEAEAQARVDALFPPRPDPVNGHASHRLVEWFALTEDEARSAAKAWQKAGDIPFPRSREEALNLERTK